MNILTDLKICLLAFILAVMALFGQPSALNAQSEPVLLTIALPLVAGSGHRSVQMTLSSLQALPVSRFETTTNWTTGPQTFTGVYLKDLLDHFDVTSGQIELWAINDYSITIPVADVRPEGALIAYFRNGAPMVARNKGPLWLVYNYDSDAAFRNETTYIRSIWQLDRIAISR